MTLKYVIKISFLIQKTDFDVQKIDGLARVIYIMAIAGFSLQHTLKKIQFFEETFLLIDISIEVMLRISLLTFSDANIRFAKKVLV